MMNRKFDIGDVIEYSGAEYIGGMWIVGNDVRIGIVTKIQNTQFFGIVYTCLFGSWLCGCYAYELRKVG